MQFFKGITILSVAGFLAVAIGACGGDDDDNGNGVATDLCQKGMAKVSQCNIPDTSFGDCNARSDARTKCSFACLAAATCDQISDQTQNPDNPFYQCLVRCVPDAG